MYAIRSYYEKGDSDGDGVGGESVGVGASVAINVGNNDTHARVDGLAEITGADDLAIAAEGAHEVTSQALGGAAGGTAVTPVVAVTVAQNDTTAILEAGSVLTLGGDLTITASHDNSASSRVV